MTNSLISTLHPFDPRKGWGLGSDRLLTLIAYWLLSKGMTILAGLQLTPKSIMLMLPLKSGLEFSFLSHWHPHYTKSKWFQTINDSVLISPTFGGHLQHNKITRCRSVQINTFIQTDEWGNNSINKFIWTTPTPQSIQNFTNKARLSLVPLLIPPPTASSWLSQIMQIQLSPNIVSHSPSWFTPLAAARLFLTLNTKFFWPVQHLSAT